MAEGRGAEARRVEETELTPAVASARRAAATELEADDRLRTIMAEDEERVAEAIAYAEVIVPMFTERLRSIARAEGPARAMPAPNRQRPKAPGEAPAIADFIDEMLAHDRAASS